jgi:hypothetical protein
VAGANVQCGDQDPGLFNGQARRSVSSAPLLTTGTRSVRVVGARHCCCVLFRVAVELGWSHGSSNAAPSIDQHLPIIHGDAVVVLRGTGTTRSCIQPSNRVERLQRWQRSAWCNGGRDTDRGKQHVTSAYLQTERLPAAGQKKYQSSRPFCPTSTWPSYGVYLPFLQQPPCATRLKHPSVYTWGPPCTACVKM